MIKAKIIADSISAHTGTRITTMELEYPRFIHCEFMTHRQFSRNASSSRAIPIDKMIEQAYTNTAIPIHWGLNQKGMQAKDEVADEAKCISAWLDARDSAIKHALKLKELGLHKQIVNRVLEPFQMMKTLVTATSFDNFFNLRCHKDAQPEIKALADIMYQVMQKSKPIQLKHGEWHTPYVEHTRSETGKIQYYTETDGNYIELSLNDAIKVSCSCSAQVSYRKNDTSIKKAKDIYDKLINSNPVHASAFEHCATPMLELDDDDSNDMGVTHFAYSDAPAVPCSGNFANWVQYRQLIPNHDCHEFKKG